MARRTGLGARPIQHIMPGSVTLSLYSSSTSANAPFASGGIVSGTGYSRGRAHPQAAISPAPPGPGSRWYAGPSYVRGIDGFDGRGALPAPDPAGGIPDVYGVVRGYRWWTLPAPPLHLSPAHAEENWPGPVRLRGQMDTWQPGENVAACKTSYPHDPALVPLEPCGCGFWGYWRLQRHELGGCALPVCGVIEGYGAVLLGTKGFRAARARIVALHLPFQIHPASAPDEDPLGLGLPPGSPGGGIPGARWRRPDYRKPAPEPPEPTAEEIRKAAEEIRKADEDRAEAWMAVIGDRLEREYPGARIFETREAMEKYYPPDTAYEPPALCRCGESRDFAYVGMNGHKYDCPQYR